MFCRGCEYELSGLSPGACPECGRQFDPGDASSVATAESLRLARRRWRWVFWGAPITACWPILVHAWVHLMLLVARLELGRWPHRMGRDDPKFINIVSEMHTVGVIGMLVSPLMLMAGLFAFCLAFWRDWRLALPLLVLVIGAWVALRLIGDPAQAWVWFMD